MVANHNSAYSPVHHTFQIGQLVVLELVKSTKYILYGMISITTEWDRWADAAVCIIPHTYIGVTIKELRT